MKGKIILIVDDEERNIKLLKACLAQTSYHTVGVPNGEELLNIMQTLSPDLILLDAMMPGIDGFEVCKRLKQCDGAKMIPIVMVTALTEKEHRVRAMEAGADDFISKPVDRTELLIRVNSLLRLKSYHDELMQGCVEIAEKNEELNALEKTKDGLLHMIVHDLRNPLTAISMNLELQLIDKTSSTEENHVIMEKCLAYCRELNQMIQELLDIHEMESGVLKFEKESIDLEEVLAGIFEQIRPQIEAKKIHLACAGSEGNMYARADRRVMKRVIVNLLTNAVRHTPDEGSIEVSVTPCSDGNSLCIGIRDNGEGLLPEYHQRIFNKFEQAKLRRTGVKVGASGLGLTFCKMAIEAHGGKIWVESGGIGSGCLFKFVIPAHASEEE